MISPRRPALPPMIRLRLLQLAALWLAATPLTAAAQADYDPGSSAWNGLSELSQIAESEAATLQPVSRLDLGTLTPDDSLIIVYPRGDVPASSLAAFMRAGGRVALADDYGNGDDLLSVYRIVRRVADATDAPHLRGNSNLPIARPRASHTLNEGIGALVANHPAALWHDDLEPIFAFDDGGGALVLAGAVGDGRLVAIGDPSMLINNMLQFRDNRRFAANLVRYLTTGRHGRVYVATGDAVLVGRYGEPGADEPFHDLSTWLADVAHGDAPPIALTVGAIVLSAILLIVAVTSLPRRSPYDGSAMFARPALAGGFVGRVWFFKRRPGDLLHPLLVYKYELEGEMVQRLQLTGRTLLRDVLAALRRAGLTTDEVEEARSLILSLDSLRERQDHPSGPPRVDAQQFRSMVAAGERILGRLESGELRPGP